MNIKKILFLGLSLITGHNSCAMETSGDVQVIAAPSWEDRIRTLCNNRSYLEAAWKDSISAPFPSTENRLKYLKNHPTQNTQKPLLEPKEIIDRLNAACEYLIMAIEDPTEFSEYFDISEEITRQLTGQLALLEKGTISTQELQMLHELVRDEFYHKLWKAIIANGLPSSIQDVHRDAYQKMLDLNNKIENLTAEGLKDTEHYLNTLLKQQHQTRQTRRTIKQGTENNSARGIQVVVPALPSMPSSSSDTMRTSNNNNATTITTAGTQRAKAAANRPQHPELLQQINAGNFSLKATPAQVKSKKEKTPTSVFETALDLRRSVIDSKEAESVEENSNSESW